MELAAAVRRRKMVRAFSDAPVDDAVLDEILDLAARAPSAGATQGVDLLVLTDAPDRARFWAHASSAAWRAGSRAAEGITAAPVVIVVLADPQAYEARYRQPDKAASPLGRRAASSWPVPYWAVDAGFHAMVVLLSAADVGLGALFFHVRGDTAALAAEFGVPGAKSVIGAVALGHAAPGTKSTPSRPRRPLSTIVHRGRW